MSSQRGNLKKKAQKHKNVTAFKNNKYQSNKRIESLNHLVIRNVCERCKNTIEWRIKYKKYKPLTCPQKCVKCEQKCVKYAYHMICTDCSLKEGSCAKCGKKEPIVIPHDTSQSEKQREESLLKEQLKGMSLRERKAFLRKMDNDSKDDKDSASLPSNEDNADHADSDDDDSSDDCDDESDDDTN